MAALHQPHGDAPDRGRVDGEWQEHASRRLHGAGHRAGGARAAVVDVLAGENCCLTAQEIYDTLRSEDRRVGMASVYRALDLLQGLGLVSRVDLGGGTARFEAARPAEHHHHLVCVDCGRVSAFDHAPLERAIDDVAAREDYVVHEHDVVLRGRCPDCRRDGTVSGR